MLFPKIELNRVVDTFNRIEIVYDFTFSFVFFVIFICFSNNLYIIVILKT